MNGLQRLTLDDDRDFLVWRPGSGGTVEIFDIQVGTARRRGRGRDLLGKLFALPEVRDVPTVWAITRASNEIAQQFYEACYFHVSRTLRRFYERERGVDAILYARSPRGPL